MTLTFDLYDNHNSTFKFRIFAPKLPILDKITGKSCDLDLQFVCFVYCSFYVNIMMHCHGEFNLITPENVKNLKIINVYILH